MTWRSWPSPGSQWLRTRRGPPTVARRSQSGCRSSASTDSPGPVCGAGPIRPLTDAAGSSEESGTMKITAVEVIGVQVPMEFAYGDATQIPSAIATIRTDEGLEGLGHVTTLYGRQFKSLIAAVEELAEQLVGEDPRNPERIHRKILADGLGVGGTGNLAA